MNQRTVILYHADCADGFGAAFAAWSSLGDDAAYIPVQYGSPPPPAAWEAERMYILDFSYDRQTIGRLARSVAHGVTVLDHHKTAREELLEALGDPGTEIIFNMDHSGAVLSWNYFHPGEPVPLLLRYVQDRDLWRWELPSSREFSAALAVEPRDFRRWDEIDRLTRDLNAPGSLHWLFGFLDRGKAILSAQRQHVESLASNAHWVEIAGHRVPAVNSPIWQSEIGERLCELHTEAPFAAIFMITEPGVEVWSLRSRNGFDVSAVARSLGGGGHAAAAGFKRPRPGTEVKA
jgi:oligoribonuclease NrnB/cAMP/cGMP phosphodiesterase (DHH superfamily)